MVELRRRAQGPPVDSRDDHQTTASGLDRTNTQPHNTTVSNTAADHEAPAEKPRRVLSRSPDSMIAIDWNRLSRSPEYAAVRAHTFRQFPLLMSNFTLPSSRILMSRA